MEEFSNYLEQKFKGILVWVFDVPIFIVMAAIWVRYNRKYFIYSTQFKYTNQAVKQYIFITMYRETEHKEIEYSTCLHLFEIK